MYISGDVGEGSSITKLRKEKPVCIEKRRRLKELKEFVFGPDVDDLAAELTWRLE